MTRYVALLRGIGPATHVVMPLKALAARLAKADLADVINVGNTGNLVFESEVDEGEAKKAVSREIATFAGGTEVFLRTRRQIQMLLGAGLFPDAIAERPGRVGVCFFHTPPRWTFFRLVR